MKKSFNDLPSDTANISALLELEMNLDVESKYPHKIKLQKGWHKIVLEIKDSWNGPIKITEYVFVEKEDNLVIGDSCYFIKEEDVDKFCEETDYGANLYGKGGCLQTGGDGNFDLDLQIEKIKRPPSNPYNERLARAKKIASKALSGKIKAEEALDTLRLIQGEGNYSQKIWGLMLDIQHYDHEKTMAEFQKLMKKIK